MVGQRHWVKKDENPYKSLPAAPIAARRIPLDTSLEVERKFDANLEGIPIRECLRKFAIQSESTRERQRAETSRRYAKWGLSQDDTPLDSRTHVGNKTPVLGSEDRRVMWSSNYGFFSTVMTAYDNHYSLRTCVEDWWFTIVHKIGLAIDNHSTQDFVRDFFVSHQGKKKLTVEVGKSVYGVDYGWFLDQMTRQISENIKVPNFVDLMKSDYSTSTGTHAIVSEITIMASVQEFFVYEMGRSSCGIPSIEMEGTEEDWTRMKEKFLKLKELLEPIRQRIGLREEWWDKVEKICDELIQTFNGNPNIPWWGHIFSKDIQNGSGARSSFYGWFICDFLGFDSPVKCLSSLNEGVVTVPLTITDHDTEDSEQSAFAAGIAGYEMFKEEDSKWASVKAVHGWTLMLKPDSVHRNDIMKWEAQHLQGA